MAIVMALAAVLELAYRADSNSAVREDLWVRVPPAVPSHSADQFPCRAVPPDATLCIDVLDLDDRAMPSSWDCIWVTACSREGGVMCGGCESVSTPSIRASSTRRGPRSASLQVGASVPHLVPAVWRSGETGGTGSACPATWPRSEAPSTDPPRTLAGPDHRGLPGGLPCRPHPIRRMSLREPRQGTRVPAILILEFLC